MVKVECLRQAGVNLPEGISLEKESQNFLDSVKKVHSLAELAKVRQMLVHFHRQGVLHYDREARLTNSCYFCPGVKEDPGDSTDPCTPGTPPGILRCPCEVHGKIKTIDHNETSPASTPRRNQNRQGWATGPPAM